MRHPPTARADARHGGGLPRSALAVSVALALLSITRVSPAARAQRDPAAERAVASPPESEAAGRVVPPPDAAARAAEAEVPPPPAPERRHRLAFRAGTQPLSWADLGLTTAYVGALLALRAIDPPNEPSWKRVNRFDAALRGGLRVGNGRLDAVANASDALLYALAAYPLVVDDLALVLIGDRNPALAARLAAIDAQAFALMGLLVGVTKIGAARERPYAQATDCGANPNAPGCSEDDRNMSFFSGHAAMAFTGASLACFHQQQVEGLYGSRAAGLAVCGSAMALATSTALFRVMADKHWTTDVLAGAGIGLFSGWLMPWLTHGRTILDFEGERVSGSVHPMVDRGSYGVGVSGSF